MKNSSARLPRVLLAGLLVATIAPLANAQRADSQVRSDMAFARALASRFSYVDLAEEIVSSLDGENLSGALAEELGLVKCDVYAEGASGEGDPTQRLALYDKAVEAYRSYMKENEFSDYLPDAQRSYVNLVNNYGRTLEMLLDAQVGDEALATREKIRDVLNQGLDLIAEQIDELPFRDEMVQTQKLERWRLMLNRGQMLLTMARASEDGTFFYAKGEEILEELALEAGETSAAGLNSYILLSRVKAAQGSLRDASDFAEFVVDVVYPSDREARALRWDEEDFDTKQNRWRLVEMGTPDLVDSLLAQGDMETAAFYALHFYNGWKREGFDLTPLGYLSLLSCGRALLDAGGSVGGSVNQGDLQWFASEEEMKDAGFSGRSARSSLDLALSVASTVNDANRGNTLQVRAQRLISDITSRPGVVVSPDILFEAAQGEYNAKNFPAALQAFKGILSSLEGRDDATRQGYAPKVLFYMGRSLARMDRQLEGAMAYREAVTTWAGDPEYQEQAAQGFYSAIGSVRRDIKGDPHIEALYQEAERILADVSKNSGNLVWNQAERAYKQKDFSQARQLYTQIAEGEDLYEKARVKAGLCLYKQGDTAGADREFREYLEVYVPDATNKLTDPKKRANRTDASAVAVFYMGRMAYDAKDYEGVQTWLKGFEKKFDQPDYGTNALFMVVSAELALLRLDDAKGTLVTMTEVFPTSSKTGKAAHKIFIALSQEQEAAEKAGEEERSLDLLRQMSENLHLANQLNAKPSFNDLRRESQLWVQAKSWESAEEVLQQILGSYAEDPEQAESIERRVLPDLGLALLEQKRVPDAYEVLDPLVPDPDDAEDPRKPSGTTVRNWCRSVTGWVNGDEQNVIEVPGTGGAEDLDDATKLLLKLTEAEANKPDTGSWSCPWYELKFDTAYAYYLWGQEDSQQLASARGLISDLRELGGDPSLGGVAEKCGDDVLRRRFLWLWDKVQ